MPRGRGCNEISDLAERVAHRREILLAGRCQIQRSRAATEQLGSELFLESFDELADGTGRDMEFGRGILDAEMTSRRLTAMGTSTYRRHRTRVNMLPTVEYGTSTAPCALGR